VKRPSEDAELRSLFANKISLIDVRAPIEFAKGAIPGAVNLAVLNNEERALVGTTYKNQGQKAAIDLGRQLVSGETLEKRITGWTDFAKAHPDAQIYCFRGGLRSQSVRSALLEQGFDLPLINGGYKRLRNFMMDVIDSSAATQPMIVISGYTGAGKTRLLREVQARTFKPLDLEFFARHRGSAFGRYMSPQPTQVDFENRLAMELLPFDQKTILVEDESQKIGRIDIPSSFFTKMSESPVWVLEQPSRERAQHLIEVYLGETYGLHQGENNPEKLTSLLEYIKISLGALAKRLGGLEYQTLSVMLTSAMLEHRRSGDWFAHTEWVERLLLRYYDPFYTRHLERIHDRIALRGSSDEILDALEHRARDHDRNRI
jgi:tRNA 2-selenouridine synthase